MFNPDNDPGTPKTILRKAKKNNFTIINNDILRNPNLSWKAKGLLAYFFSLPDDWHLNYEHLVKQAKDGLDSLKSGMKELVEAGYLVHRVSRDQKGRILFHEWLVHEEPVAIKNTDYPEVENPHVGIPLEEDPPLLSTNPIPRTKEQRIKNKGTSVPLIYFGSHVKLTQEAYDKLCTDKGKAFIDDLIQKMNDYCAAHGESYKDYAAALRTWIGRQKETVQKTVQPVIIDEVKIFERREIVKAAIIKYWEALTQKGIYITDKVDRVRMGNDDLYYDNINFEQLFKHNLNKLGLI